MHQSYIVFVEYQIEPENWPSYSAYWHAQLNPNANAYLAHSRDQAGLVLEIWHCASEAEADDFAAVARTTAITGIDMAKLKVWRFEASN